MSVQSIGKRGNTVQPTSRRPDSKDENPNKKPDSVRYQNITKVGVDVYDQMIRLCSVKITSRR